MTRRDILWRGVGVAISVGACSAALVTDGSPLAILVLPIALIGLTLIIHGKRVATTLRAEHRGHCCTAAVIHAERLRRHSRRSDEAHR